MKNKKKFRLLIVIAVSCLVAALSAGALAWKAYHGREKDRISYSAFMDKVNRGSIVSVVMEGDSLTAVGARGETYRLVRPADAEISKQLLARHIDVSARSAGSRDGWIELGIGFLMVVPLFFMMKRMNVLGRSRASAVDQAAMTTLFADVAGADEAKSDLAETVEFLKEPKRFGALGGRMPSGVLLVGPPGTGKTLLARAVAGEAGVPFFSLSGSDFVEMYVGVGASRVRDLFAKARKAAPCIIFIDELDAVGKRRDGGGNGGNDERDQTLNQLLVEMDGFSAASGIVVLSATNRPEILDPALLRPGRFDRQVAVGSPDIRGREEILKVHTRKVPLDAAVDLRTIARGTPGLSGADLANIVNEAAILAARTGRTAVAMDDFEAAKDKVLMGAEKRSAVLSDKVKLSTAWHEAGHVMVAKLVPGCDPVHKVSIIPRGRALGVTLQIPEEDIHCYTREMLIGHVKVLMGGRAAEDLVFHTTTTGAGNDLARATKVTRRMVSEWGMSRAFGPVAFCPEDAGDGQQAACSDATALEIDSEIRMIVTACYEQVKQLLQENMPAMEALVAELLAKETLDSEEIDAALEPGMCGLA